MLIKKYFVLLLKVLNDYSSSFSIRLVKLTGKHKDLVHPKHLIKEPIWFKDNLNKSDSLLDIGSGVGRTTINVSKHVANVVGLEIDDRLVTIGNNAKRGKKNIKFIQGNANKKLTFRNDSFDKVLASDVIEHLDRRKLALMEIKRVLKNNGLLFLVIDNPDTSWKKLQKSTGLSYYADREHKYEYPKKEIINLLQKNQFEILSINTVTYDTPLKGLIDLTGGVSITIYKKLRKWRKKMNNEYPQETTGYRIVAKNIK